MVIDIELFLYSLLSWLSFFIFHFSSLLSDLNSIKDHNETI